MKLALVAFNRIHKVKFTLTHFGNQGPIWVIEHGRDVGPNLGKVIIPLAKSKFNTITKPDPDGDYSLIKIDEENYVLTKAEEEDEQYLVFLNCYKQDERIDFFDIVDKNLATVILRGYTFEYNDFEGEVISYDCPILLLRKGAEVRWGYRVNENYLDAPKSYILTYGDNGLRVRSLNKFEKAIEAAYKL